MSQLEKEPSDSAAEPTEAGSRPDHPAAASGEYHFADVRFADLPLREELKLGIAEAGFEHCTPIQAEALPRALEGRDVAGQAQTGTGKTAAFLLALMQRLLESSHEGGARDAEEGSATRGTGTGITQPRALVLAPTRELALQIHRDAVVLGRHTGLRCGVVYGGTGYVEQRDMVRAGIDVLIGTPGRTIDYFKQKVFDLRAVEVVVLDEADRMFDLGFIKDIRFLLRRMPRPEHRQNMLFSATMSHRVTELAYEHMNDPTVVNVSPDEITVREVRQQLYHVSKEEKIPLLIGLLRSMDASRTIVFVNTKHGAERVARYLEANGFEAGLLSGDVPQRKRMNLLERFQNAEIPLLVATDVAARGLHIENVSHVFNFDLPQDAEDYVHRIGRTARAGAEGDAVSFACEEFVFSLEEIEDFIGQRLAAEFVSDDLLAEVKRPPRAAPRPGRPRSGPRRSDGRRGDGGSRGRGGRSGGRRRGGGPRADDTRGESTSEVRAEPSAHGRSPAPPVTE